MQCLEDEKPASLDHGELSLKKLHDRHFLTLIFLREECENQVKGFSGAAFKKFKSQKEAQAFIEKAPPVKKQKSQTKISFSAAVDAISKTTKRKAEEENCDEIFHNLPEFPDEPSTSKLEPATKKSKTLAATKIPYDPPKPTTQKTYKGYKFNEDSDGFVHVYTDGSSFNNGKYSAAAGFGVFFGDNHPLNVSEPVIGRPTNNVAEIQAAIKAVKIAQSCEVKRLNIFTDSQFLMKSACIWTPIWKKKDWKVQQGKAVVNQKDFKELDSLIESGNMLVKWSYIPAHRGKHGNEEADRLAKNGASLYRSKRDLKEGKGSDSSDEF